MENVESPVNQSKTTKNNPFKTMVYEKRRYKCGYIVKKQIVTLGKDSFFTENAYTFSGKYIGSPKDARYLIVTRKIKPTTINKTKKTCSIGFCKIENRWYGWSHRAMCGFTVGDKIFEEDFKKHLNENIRDQIPFIKHGKITIKTLKQAKQSAINFAEYVS